jgi:prefoldin subunit 5
MAADSGNDVIMQYQSQKENYEREIEKLAARVEKQTQQDKELKQALAAL